MGQFSLLCVLVASFLLQSTFAYDSKPGGRCVCPVAKQNLVCSGVGELLGAAGYRPFCKSRPACDFCRVLGVDAHSVIPLSRGRDCESTGDDVRITVKTSQRVNSGTHANVFIAFEDLSGSKPVRTRVFKLRYLLSHPFKTNATDVFRIPRSYFKGLSRVCRIRVYKDDCNNQIESSNWWVETITVRLPGPRPQSFVFPYNRWVPENQEVLIYQYDTFLPKDDPNKAARAADIAYNREQYQMINASRYGPLKVKDLPAGEEFSPKATMAIATNGLTCLAKMEGIYPRENYTFKTLDEYWTLFNVGVVGFDGPKWYMNHNWRSDEYFGLRRLHGLDKFMLHRVRDRVPEKLAVSDAMLAPFLEGITIAQAIQQKRLYYVDLKILDGILTKLNFPMWAPLALFYYNRAQKLVPIAIQLYQEPCVTNPVFLPSDPEYTWMLAKMYYATAEENFHQFLAHLGWKHAIGEGLQLTLYRNVAPAHPIVRLLKPHLLHNLALTHFTYARGVSQDQVDLGASFPNSEGIKLFQWALSPPYFKLRIHGNLRTGLDYQGLTGPGVLPNFFARDQSLAVNDAIERYVANIVNHYYPSDAKVREDVELRNWHRDLIRPISQGGLGYKVGDVPGTANGFQTRGDLIELLNIIMSTATLLHSIEHIENYPPFAFTPETPQVIYKAPPTNKLPLTERQVVDHLFNASGISEICVLSMLGFTNITNSMMEGNDEQFTFDPPAVRIYELFKSDLQNISEIWEANDVRDPETSYRSGNPYLVINSFYF
jgi:arachidonate 5-lipoxygenase